MKTRSKWSRPRRAGGWLVVLVAAFVLAGCQSFPLGVKNGIVSEEDRIPIAESGEHSGKWETRDLSLGYKYVRNQSRMEMTGLAHFAGQLKNSFPLLEYFHMDVIFVNSEGRVLQMVGLMSDAKGSTESPESFAISLIVPPDAASMAFSYRGEAHGIEADESGSGTYFWHYPIH